jgi:uncharacterized membrane protein HdeD (DUF308 family)
LIFVSVGSVALTGGVLAARYRKNKRDWISLHKKMVLFGAASILAGLSVAAYMVFRYMETYFVQEPHAYLGASTFVFIVATPIRGIAQFWIKDRRNTNHTQMVRPYYNDANHSDYPCRNPDGTDGVKLVYIN